MTGNIESMNIDVVNLFGDCLAQATMVVKQVLPAHATNATPDTEWDVRDNVGIGPGNTQRYGCCNE